MTLEQNLTAAFQAVGADIKALQQGKTVAFDTAARKTNGTVQPGALMDSGHRATVRANVDQNRFKWQGGFLVHDRGGASGTATTASAAYLGTQMPGTVGRAWVDFQVTDSQSEDVVLVVSGGSRPFTTPTTVTSGIVGSGFTNAGAHLVISPAGWSYGILTDTPWTIDEVAAGAFSPPLEPDVTHTMRVDFAGDTVTITTPRGVAIKATDARIATSDYRGPYATVELYAATGVSNTASRIVSWGAAQEAPLAALAFAAPEKPQVTSMSYQPATQVDITVPTASADISPQFGLPVTVPASGKLLIRAQVWLEQAGADSIYLMGLNIGSGSGDGLQRVVEGPYKGIVTAEWLWNIPVPGYTLTVYPEHFMVGTGPSTVRFGAGSGYFGSISAAPV